MPRTLPAVLWTLVLLSPLVGDEPTRQERVERRLAELRKLSDADLFARYDTASVVEDSFGEKDEVTRENVLVEVVRRGGPAAEKWLRAKMEADYEQKIKEKEVRDALTARHEADPKNEALAEEYRKSQWALRRLEDNLAIFTALRRVQKKTDPLTVTVTVPKDAVATTRELPTLGVKLTNTDPEQLPLWFTFGGDYRSGRLARWRIEAVDDKGRPVPEPPGELIIEGGGLFGEGTLGGGQSWEGHLPMASFVRIREPGEYMVRVLYHNHVTIADDGMNGLIVFESKPFKLKVAPKKVITLHAGDRARARAAIAALDEREPVRVVTDNYGPEYHAFIPPDSPAGRLHDLGWRAVPTLLEVLRDEKVTPRRRAWVVGLLYGITRKQGMNPFGITPDWERVVGPYHVKGPGSAASGGGTPLDGEQQKKLAAAWLKFGDEYLDVREAK
jgi:hypothetical protein